MAPWTHMSQPPYGISISSPVLAQYTRITNTDTQTHTRTTCATSVATGGLKIKKALKRKNDTRVTSGRRILTKGSIACRAVIERLNAPYRWMLLLTII